LNPRHIQLLFILGWTIGWTEGAQRPVLYVSEVARSARAHKRDKTPLVNNMILYRYVIHQDDDDEGPKFKDILCDFLKKSMDVLCIWDCCKLWIRTAEVSTARTSYLAACQKAAQVKKVRGHYYPYGHLH
jgi:hypothetical protein